MLADADLARIGSLMGDPRRAAILLELLGGAPVSAGALAERAGVSSSLASAHLSKLLDGGLVRVRQEGRSRLYALRDERVAEAIEAMLLISPPRGARSLRESNRGSALRHARTCYDHLAGELGVGVTSALVDRGVLRHDGGALMLTEPGERELVAFGVDVPALRAGRRALTRSCVDWTEREPHLAGALGAGLASRIFELGWVSRRPATRALRVTREGERELRAHFGVA